MENAVRLKYFSRCLKYFCKVLTNVSFTVAPGTTTAIVGASGSGKTTLGKLLARLYDVTEGEVKSSDE